MTSGNQKRLTSFAAKLVNWTWAIGLAAALIWPLMAIASGMGLLGELDKRTIDVFLGLQVIGDDQGTALFHSHAYTSMPVPDERTWYLVATITEIAILIFLFAVYHLRKVFRALAEDQTFSRDMATHIKMVGIVVIGWQIFAPLVQFFAGRLILSDLSLATSSLKVYPAFELNVAGIFTGLAILVLSGILLEAADLHEDQALTI